jgi:hypothetical protein
VRDQRLKGCLDRKYTTHVEPTGMQGQQAHYQEQPPTLDCWLVGIACCIKAEGEAEAEAEAEAEGSRVEGLIEMYMSRPYRYARLRVRLRLRDQGLKG